MLWNQNKLLIKAIPEKGIAFLVSEKWSIKKGLLFYQGDKFVKIIIKMSTSWFFKVFICLKNDKLLTNKKMYYMVS